MVGQTYEEQKSQTIQEYFKFRKLAEGLTPVFLRNVNLQTLEEKVTNIQNNKFTLMVVGEAKSGKSTFINAYLNTDILPMSVEQCTSAIIEISYSKDKCLTYYTAGGQEFHLNDEQDIRDFLSKNAALNDKFRKIPIASIDQIIINRKGHVPPSELDNMVKDLQDDNIYNLSPEDFSQLIHEYVENRKQNWGKIVVRLIISYPFDPQLKDISIIDSPGVNALGQVGDITEDYIEKANAVVFIKCLTGQALESKSFKAFLGTKNAYRHKESLFVFLSRASDHIPADLETLVSRARSMYSNVIKPEKIIPIDSLVQLYYNRLHGKTEQEIQQILKDEAKSKIGFPWVSDAWQWKENVDSFFEDLDAKAGFQQINKLFEQYARQAQRLALSELLTGLSDAYRRINGFIKHEIDLTDKQITMTPEQLAGEIKERQDNLDELLKELNSTVFVLEKEFKKGTIAKKKNEIIKNVTDALEATSLDELESQITRITDPLKKYKEEMAKSAIMACNQALRVKCEHKDFDSWMVDILVPDFPEREISEIKTEVKKDDDVYDISTTGITFKETHKSINNEKYRQKVIESISTRLDNMASKAQSELVTFIGTIFDRYHDKLSKSVEEEKKILEEKKVLKKSMEELRNTLESYRKQDVVVSENQKSLSLIKKAVEDGINKQ